jgi:DNA-binding NarL/FixJ family response regulator
MIPKGSDRLNLDVREIIRLFQDGMPIDRIADKMECSSRAIRTRLVANGIIEKRKIIKKASYDEQQIISEFLGGEYMETLQEKYSMSYPKLKGILDRNGVDTKSIMTKNKNLPKQLFDKKYLIEEYLTKHKPFKHIAKELGVSATTVKRYLIKHGIELRTDALKDGYKHGYIEGRSGADSPTFGRDATHGKGQWMCLDGKWVYMRSSWEVTVAKFLFLKGYNYKYEEVRYDLGDTTYRPDFFIYKENGELDFIIEVKGWYKDEFVRKLMLFKTLYPDIDYVLLDKSDYENILQEVA